MSEHQSIYRPIGTALRQEQFFRNGTGRKQPTKTSQILWNKSYSCLYINYEWLFQGWLIGLCMCLQIRFHKRMGADCTNRNSARNHFFPSRPLKQVRLSGVSATAPVQAQRGLSLQLGAPSQCQGHSDRWAACLKHIMTGSLTCQQALGALVLSCCSLERGAWQCPEGVGLEWQQVDPCLKPLPPATAIPPSFFLDVGFVSRDTPLLDKSISV